MAAKIEDYALIGDCETAAIVDNRGSIDWLCWPDFASEACFAALLGKEENGYWRICPCDGEWKTTRRYREHTLILETTFEHARGTVRLIDFMPIREHHSDVVRIVEGVNGSVPMRMDLALRFDYGHTVPWVTGISDGVRAVAGPHLAMLHGSIPVRGENLTTVADFTVNKGDRIWFTLTYGLSFEPDPDPIDAEQALRDTENFWTPWASRLHYSGKYREAVERSLIALKAMTFRPSGGLVAAITSSLPEELGGVRNWDYRFCWVRDTTFTLMALTSGGYYEEAVAWQDWLLRAIAGSPDQVQIMYGLKGERQLVEWEVDWLSGYENSQPVRVGNAAAGQVQIDIYGEMLDSFFHAQKSMGAHAEQDFRVLVLLLNHLENIWRDPDHGIWETRGKPQQFTYSKVMAWVAFDRAVKLAEQLHYQAPLDKWRKIRDTIHAEVCAQAFNKRKGCFVQAYGSSQLDAALLLIPQVGFLPGSDPRIKATVEAIERELMPDGLVLRYNTSKVKDGLPPGEGVFIACSFWMVSSLKSIGRPDDARRLFERLLSLRNDLGLLSEEYDLKRKRMVGNFPQAFSHIALVIAACDLENEEGICDRSQGLTGAAAEPAPPLGAKLR
ncbi:MAG TPA: glycoside hydrolase family 15 protein [Terracidiphilus sp.]|jgi:GH15 family glucan-1,4-alpha-glucosidase|nr:glycoside hydrolase family 15 protein [Terracidiphilus sp.]